MPKAYCISPSVSTTATGWPSAEGRPARSGPFFSSLLDNFGIVDPDNLKLLLLPTDDNRGRATAIKGRPQKQIEKMLFRHDGS